VLLQAGQAGAAVVGSTRASNSLPQLLQAYSKIGIPVILSQAAGRKPQVV
jgi:hypothetical protein